MTKIIAFAGAKHAGKTTLSTWYVGQHLKRLGICEGYSLHSTSELLVSDIFGEDGSAGVVNVQRPTIEQMDFLYQYVYDEIRPLSFASPLKHVCMNMFGLSYDQCFGDGKNTETDLLWENMPFVGVERPAFYKDSGRMLARETMQVFGTDICRAMCENAHINPIVHAIDSNGPKHVVVDDVRFNNEFDVLKERGAHMIYIDGRGDIGDSHASESGIDREFDLRLDNSGDIDQTCGALLKYLQSNNIL